MDLLTSHLMSYLLLAAAIADVVLAIGNFCASAVALKERRYVLAAASGGLAVVLTLAAHGLFTLVFPDCRNAPPIVEYRDGMTLCPGQIAIERVPAAPAPPMPTRGRAL